MRNNMNLSSYFRLVWEISLVHLRIVWWFVLLDLAMETFVPSINFTLVLDWNQISANLRHLNINVVSSFIVTGLKNNYYRLIWLPAFIFKVSSVVRSASESNSSFYLLKFLYSSPSDIIFLVIAILLSKSLMQAFEVKGNFRP